MLKKFPSGKINVTKNAILFLSQTLAHHSFTLNSQFFHRLKHMIHPTKTVREIFHFRFRLAFIKVLYLFNKKYDLFTLKRHNSFQNKNNTVDSRKLELPGNQKNSSS